MRSERRFRDRADAGRQLGEALGAYAGRGDLVVLALPRGGVPVGFEVARALAAPLDVFLVRKVGVPGHEELALGAVASGGTRVVNEGVLGSLALTAEEVEGLVRREEAELARRETLYRRERAVPSLAGKVALLVDDGLATGASMRAAVAAVRAARPARVVVAVPAAAPRACAALAPEADELVCLLTPEPFRAVGLWYDDFPETTDDEVRALLERAPAPP